MLHPDYRYNVAQITMIFQLQILSFNLKQKSKHKHSLIDPAEPILALASDSRA